VSNKADGYSKEELMEVFERYNVRVPENGNELTEPEPFNLMFPTPIGPEGLVQGYLRPETAQGIFLNYKFCLEQNANRLPFGVAQVGKVYRNEIAPRQGLCRQREFSQMEIEWFVNPTAKQSTKFQAVKNLKLQLFPAKEQLAGLPHITKGIGEAVAEKMVDNETLGYFIARTHLFLLSIGIKADHLRFRQHLPTEMAHYASDCWDAEIETSLGWLECVGIADRACFDLNAHATATKVDLMYRETLDTPIVEEVTKLTKAAGIATMKAFGKTGKATKEYLETLPMDDLKSLVAEVTSKGEATRKVGDSEATFKPEHVVVEVKQEKKTTNCFMPGVVEPSFGIDRIFFSCLEHAYYSRPKEEGTEDDKKQTRGVLSFPAAIAPYKMTILPVDQRVTRDEKYVELNKAIRERVAALGHSCTVDDSNATIGKRYSRNDELGIPFACTVDFDSLKDNTVTLRERDSMKQVRLPADKLPMVIHEICWGRKVWADVQNEYKSFTTCTPK
jgi:glycyl-tRNA synthetase